MGSTSSSSLLSTFINKNTYRNPSPFVFSPARSSTRFARTSVRAQESPTWLPGLDPPAYLNGILAGDYGFDPLGLGEDPESLKWYRACTCSLCNGWLQLLRVTRLVNLPIWYEAGAVKIEFASTTTLIIVQFLLMGFVETKRHMDFASPGSQAQYGTFFGIEAALEGSEIYINTLGHGLKVQRSTSGGPLFNPLGLARDEQSARVWKLKEIKNGRLVMMAMLGIFVQTNVTHAGPIDNLVKHLSNPLHTTVIQTLAGSGS
ncbi:hypothetical protein MKX01_005914 [Papaver californicum]|nr:hypothetical protein MKX01_005914 [Papaver californicum]